jgi:hypothetical protein
MVAKVNHGIQTLFATWNLLQTMKRTEGCQMLSMKKIKFSGKLPQTEAQENTKILTISDVSGGVEKLSQ